MASQSSLTKSTLKKLTTNDLALLCNTLNPVASNCLALGLQLGVEYPQMCTIENDYRKSKDRLREIISERLKQDSPLTWHDIVSALRSPSVNHSHLARDIESQYISPSQERPATDSSNMTTHTSAHHSIQAPAQCSFNTMSETHTQLIPPSINNSVGTSQSLHSLLPNQCLPQLPQPVNPQYTYFTPPWQPFFPPQLLQMSSPSINQLVSSSEQSSSTTSSAVVASQSNLQCTQPGYVYPSSIVSCTIPHTQPPASLQTGWGIPYGYLPHMYPQQMYQGPHTSIPDPYPIPSHMSATTTPLHGIVGGQLESQSHTSHGQPEMSHGQLQRHSSTESCPPPHKRPHLQFNPELPSTESNSASQSVKSAHHSSPMDTFIHYIKVTYKRCEIEKNLNVVKWPPTPSKIFINLACIDWESVMNKVEADEYTRAMVEDGNVDVIMKKKRNIDFDDIVRDLPATALEKVVLVEGAPGVGKSTFAWEFCRRWERGEIAQQYQLVLLLRLRDERMSRAKGLRDLIYHSSESVYQPVVDELESTLGVNTLIILEGFDELPDSQRKEPSIFLQLILGQLLPLVTILVTSRPWATSALLVKIKHRIFQHVEILGFTEKNIKKYVTSVFIGEGKKTASATDKSVGGQDEVSEEAKKNIDGVMAYISKYPQIKACMYIPLNAAIVVSIYRESMKSKWVLPTTLTELYQVLTRILLLRYLHGHAEYSHQKWSVESFKDLPTEVYSQLLVISKTAYDGICREGGKSVQLIFPDIPDDFETLGLMQSVSQLFMDGQKTSHNFLHLTVQEFLAAFLISTMSPAEQLKHFQRHKDGRLRVVLRFLAGLTKLNKVTTDELRSLFGEPTVKQSDEHQTPYCNPMRPDVCVSAHLTNWLFEAQNSELLQSLFHNHTESFTFTRGMLPLEYYSVGYCIAHSHSKWSLTFDRNTEVEKLHMLVNGAKTGDSYYKITLKTTSSMIPENMHILVNGFSSNVEELYLQIPDNRNSLSLPPLSKLRILELQIEFALNISCDFSFPSLEALIISSSKGILGVKTCKAIGKLLSSTTSLKEFHISRHKWWMHVGDQDIEMIIKGLSDNIALSLKSLDIDCKCTFTTTATWYLAQFIRRSTTLQYFEIRIDTFEDVNIFTKALNDNIALPLKSLDIDCLSDNIDLLLIQKSLVIDCKCTFLTITATRSLVQFITRSTTLQYIRICHVPSSAQGLMELTEAIYHCSSLQVKKLKKLTFCVECSEDVVNLRRMIKDHPDIPEIIDWNEVVAIHLSSIEDNIMTISTLNLAFEYGHIESLDLGSKNIRDAGAVALAQALHHNSTPNELYLSNNNISDVGAVALAQALHHNCTLKVLYLFNNNISDAGTVALAQALHHNCTLDELNLYNSNISDVGAVALAQALHHNSTLEELNLSKNNICDVGAVALAKALHHNSTLKFLSLYGNDGIGKEGTHQLVQALTVNTSITTYGLILPMRCEEYATQCNTVKDRILFFNQLPCTTSSLIIH